MKVGRAKHRYLTGYIEGYYGRMLRWEERADLVQVLSETGASAYLYAPKEDPLHRQDWRKPYSVAWKKSFTAWVKTSLKKGVEVIPGMAPGLSFDYTSQQDKAALIAKLKAFQKMGCRKLALLMDDIPDSLPKSSIGHFTSLGIAHGELLSELAVALKMKPQDLWFCPTVYCDGLSGGGVANSLYLKDLAQSCPKQIPIMWTGPGIISSELSTQLLKALNQHFGKRVLLWDNFYANDYCPQKLFVGPLVGRNRNLAKSTQGLLLNPTGLPQTDALLLRMLGDWVEGQSIKAAWKKQVLNAGVPQSFFTVATFLSSPFFDISEKHLTEKNIQQLRKALKPLIWSWKSLLQSEWYPYLFMLDADLKAASRGAEKPDVNWLRKRYSPIVAHLLLARPQKSTARTFI